MIQNYISPYSSVKLFLGVCSAVIFSIFLISAVHAETIDSAYEIAIAKAVSKIESEDFDGARSILQDILKTEPEG